MSQSRRASLMAIVTLATTAAAAPAPPLSPASSVDDVLAAMKARGGDLKSFAADLVQRQEDLGQGGVVTYRGRAQFQARPGGDARLHLVLDTKQREDGPRVPDRREYLLQDGWVTDRSDRDKTESRRQLVRPGQKLDLFQLDKGQFPLPIGQDVADVHRLFDVAKLPPAAGDPAGTIHLQLKPKPGTNLARQFSTVDFWVDPAPRMPVRIETVDAKGAMDETNDLLNLKVNPPVGDADFKLPPLPPSWRTSDTPLAD